MNEYVITDLINDECYEEYYKQSIDWDRYYEQKEENEDGIFDEMEEEK